MCLQLLWLHLFVYIRFNNEIIVVICVFPLLKPFSFNKRNDHLKISPTTVAPLTRKARVRGWDVQLKIELVIDPFLQGDKCFILYIKSIYRCRRNAGKTSHRVYAGILNVDLDAGNIAFLCICHTSDWQPHIPQQALLLAVPHCGIM